MSKELKKKKSELSDSWKGGIYSKDTGKIVDKK